MADQELTVVKSEPLSVVKSEPKAGERTRQDTNIISVDHDKVMQAVANAASKLPEPIRKYVAEQGAFQADLASSLFEMFSSPETVATMGAGMLKPGNPSPIPIPNDMLPRYPTAPIAERVQSAGRALETVGSDAKGGAGIAARVIGKIMQKAKPAMAEGYDRFMPNAPAPPEAPPVLSTVAAKMPKLSAAEVAQAEKWRADGVSLDEIVSRITQARTLSSSASFANLPTPAQVAQFKAKAAKGK